MEKLKVNINSIFKYKNSFNNSFTLVQRANKGINSEDFFKFAELSGQNPSVLSGYLNLSLKTLTRYRKNRKKLSPDKSEQLLKWIALYIKGTSIFGNIDMFNNWLKKPAYGLGNLLPASLLNTSTGIDLIMEELQRIEYGDLA
jgi:putative toxin-antitoxin system antitoxin component (TIGR02293 family)